MPFPAQPTAIKKMRGNPGKRPLNENEPAYKIGLGDPYDWLSDTAKDIWLELATDLVAAGVATVADRRAFARLVSLYARLQDYEIEIAEVGETQIIKGGKKVKRPVTLLRKEAEETVARLEKEFGLTPSSRTKIKASPQAADKANWF